MSNIYSLGMDTSKHQGSKVDYAKAKSIGYGFVILRIGYKNSKDKCFEADYNSARLAGLKVGVYFYTMSLTTAEATADATRVLGWLNGKHLDLPIFYDLEDPTQKGTTRMMTNSLMYQAFKKKIDEDGRYSVGLYTGEYFFNHYINNNGLTENLWIAKYSNKEPNIGRQVSIWQFTSDEVKSDYYNGKLDRNYMLVTDMTGSKDKDSSTTKNPYKVPTRTLRKTIPCMRGDDVKWLQYELKGLTIDGIFGKQTKDAVLQYQRSNGLKVDGIVGPATRYALQND